MPDDWLPAPWTRGQRPGIVDVMANVAAHRQGRDVVLLLDGLGSLLLEEHRAHAPTLRALARDTRTIRTVLPSTTAVALASLMTGESPLRHGICGYEGFDPDQRRVFSHLAWDDRLDPRVWMPLPNIAQRTDRRCIQVGPRNFETSGLTRALYHGWGFMGHAAHSGRVDTVLSAVRAAGPDGLVYVHLRDIDHAGHVGGTRSESWRTALEDVDADIGALLRRLPRGTRVSMLADHGMVDTDPQHIIDLAKTPLADDIDLIAGEPRAGVIVLKTGVDPDQAVTRWQDVLGQFAHVMTSECALAAGLFGPPEITVSESIGSGSVGSGATASDATARRMRPRFGDLIVLARQRAIVADSRHHSQQAMNLAGVHGSATPEECLIPLVHVLV